MRKTSPIPIRLLHGLKIGESLLCCMGTSYNDVSARVTKISVATNKRFTYKKLILVDPDNPPSAQNVYLITRVADRGELIPLKRRGRPLGSNRENPPEPINQ